MPRLSAVLLTLSLLGNAALLLARHDRGQSPRHDRTDALAAPSGASSRQPTAGGDPSSAAGFSPEIIALLNGQDPARLHALLLAAGIDPDIRAQMIQALLWKKYESRLKALDPDQSDNDTLWWKEPGALVRYDSPEARQRSIAMDELNKQMSAELKAITGVDAQAFEPEKKRWQARQYGGLPREKAEALYQIGRDYDELQNEIDQEAGVFELPADQEKKRLLLAERERDIAALLTPAERAEWELRSSDTANRLRYRMGQLNATEDEYRRIYALQKTFDQEFESPADNTLFTNGSADRELEFWERRQIAQTALEARIRGIVGQERYTTAVLETDPDFTSARAAAERLSLPADTAPRLIALREPAAAESRRIANDAHLSPDAKRAALAQLAAQTRTEVTKTLGPAAAEAYFKRGAMNWLSALENGQTITVNPEGGYQSASLEADDK